MQQESLCIHFLATDHTNICQKNITAIKNVTSTFGSLKYFRTK